jgi:hypothetical protein
MPSTVTCHTADPEERAPEDVIQALEACPIQGLYCIRGSAIPIRLSEPEGWLLAWPCDGQQSVVGGAGRPMRRSVEGCVAAADPRDLIARPRVNRTADLADVNECMVYVPEGCELVD